MTQRIPTTQHEIDPFSVAPVRPAWRSLPVFLLSLPVTAVSILGAVAAVLLLLPGYRSATPEDRDRRARVVAGWLAASARMRTTVIDHNPSPDDHADLFVAPHVSMMEAPLLMSVLGHFRVLTASFTRTLPIIGPLIDATDPLYVERGEKAGKASAAEQLRDSVLRSGCRHLIFPEGTFTNGEAIIRFRSGAFIAGAPVTPVVFSYPGYVPFWNRRESSFFAQIYRMLSQVWTPVTVEILPTVHPTDAEKADPARYAERVRRLLARHAGRPLSTKDLTDSPNFQKDRRET